jgi:uncharacterized protein
VAVAPLQLLIFLQKMYQASPIKSWRKYQNRYRLLGCICNHCFKKLYPPVIQCPKCQSTSLAAYQFAATAKLITWSIIPTPAKVFEFCAPIIVAIVELEAGERITTQLVDVDANELKFGLLLMPSFRRIFSAGKQEVIHYGLKFTSKS